MNNENLSHQFKIKYLRNKFNLITDYKKNVNCNKNFF